MSFSPAPCRLGFFKCMNDLLNTAGHTKSNYVWLIYFSHIVFRLSIIQTHDFSSDFRAWPKLDEPTDKALQTRSAISSPERSHSCSQRIRRVRPAMGSIVTCSFRYADCSNACCCGADNYGETLLLPVVQMAILLSQRYCKEVSNPARFRHSCWQTRLPSSTSISCVLSQYFPLCIQ